MTRGKPKRRLRVRRKRRGEDLAEAAGEEVVWQMGCCLVETVVGVSILIGLLAVPMSLLLR